MIDNKGNFLSEVWVFERINCDEEPDVTIFWNKSDAIKALKEEYAGYIRNAEECYHNDTDYMECSEDSYSVNYEVFDTNSSLKGYVTKKNIK